MGEGTTEKIFWFQGRGLEPAPSVKLVESYENSNLVPRVSFLPFPLQGRGRRKKLETRWQELLHHLHAWVHSMLIHISYIIRGVGIDDQLHLTQFLHWIVGKFGKCYIREEKNKTLFYESQFSKFPPLPLKNYLSGWCTYTVYTFKSTKHNCR